MNQEIVVTLISTDNVHCRPAEITHFHPVQHIIDAAELGNLVRQLRRFILEPIYMVRIGMTQAGSLCYGRGTILHLHRVPLRACSRSIASKSALKFPLPKLREPCRSITSKNNVG